MDSMDFKLNNTNKEKHVVVLMDDENRKTMYLEGLGKCPIEVSALCRIPTKADIDRINGHKFKFEKFGLMVESELIDNFIRIIDGLIILIKPENITNDMVKRVHDLVKNNKDIPIVLVYDQPDTKPNGNYPTDQVIKFYRNAKSFIYTGHNSDESKNYFSGALKNNITRQKNPFRQTSISVTNNVMMDIFEKGTLPLDLWDHYGRLRIVHWCTMKYGFEETINPDGWLCRNWKKYKTSIGHGKLWHYTLTRFWATILFELQKKGKYSSFIDLYRDNSHIQTGRLFKEYYSDKILFTDKARKEWVEPDIRKFE